MRTDAIRERARRPWAIPLGLALLWVSLPLSVVAVSDDLPNPPGLRSQVEFWKKIFAHYSMAQVVIHDSWRLDRIYSVLDFSADGGDVWADRLPAYVQMRVDQEKEKIRALLLRLHQTGGRVDDDAEQRKLARLFEGDPEPDKFLAAAEPNRIRAQRGLREKFREGVRVSRRYLPEMEQIFRAEGVPVEVTRLPLLESSFDVRAYSKAGAAGIWQFIPSTGRLFLRIDDQIDERREPLAATRAAAAFLRRSYERLGTWPLAITAYNHGPVGVQRAVDALGTRDIVEIVRRYRGPNFGFASRNFYAEFLAAVEVDRHHRRYFGEIAFARPQPSRAVVVRESVPFSVLAQAAGMSVDDLAQWNLALTPAVVTGRLPVPAGYRLRLPPQEVTRFEKRYAEWRAKRGAATQVAQSKGRGKRSAAQSPRRISAPKGRLHRVQRGQTLTSIARHYGTTVEKLERQNRLDRGSPLRVGQMLVIPDG